MANPIRRARQQAKLCTADSHVRRFVATLLVEGDGDAGHCGVYGA
jgi:hypothetical protein